MNHLISEWMTESEGLRKSKRVRECEWAREQVGRKSFAEIGWKWLEWNEPQVTYIYKDEKSVDRAVRKLRRTQKWCMLSKWARISYWYSLDENVSFWYLFLNSTCLSVLPRYSLDIAALFLSNTNSFIFKCLSPLFPAVSLECRSGCCLLIVIVV